MKDDAVDFCFLYDLVPLFFSSVAAASILR